MRISATLNGNELDFVFTNLQTPNGERKWTGVSTVKGQIAKIEFIEADGIVKDLTTPDFLETPKNIVLERVLEMLKAYHDSIQMGFEAELFDNAQEVDFKPYDPEQIKVRPLVLSAYEANRLIEKKKIDLNPAFQRNFVWDDVRKSGLIESMILRIPLPAFYFAESKEGIFQVVDGLQRLTVINHFFNNKFRLKKLEYLIDCEGKYYSMDPEKKIFEHQVLKEDFVGRIETTQLSINVIEPTSPDSVKYDIFYRINTGGRPLNNQEIRNCFAKENIRELLRRMADSDIFVVSTGNSINDTRMDAQELALRFLGFYFFRDQYSGEMNPFLDFVLDKLNEKSVSLLHGAESRYYLGLSNAYYLFGKYAFRKCLPEHLQPNSKKQLINKLMFIAWTNILAEFSYDQIKIIPTGELAHLLARELEKNDNLFDSLTTGTSEKGKIEYVFSSFKSLLDRNLN